MRIKRFECFSINESFGLSSEYFNFIRNNSLDMSEFKDSLLEIEDYSEITINTDRTIVDQNGHSMNVEFEKDKQYKFLYTIVIYLYIERNGKLKEFENTQSRLNLVIDNVNAMIGRVSGKVKLKSSNYDISKQVDQIKYTFNVKFESDIIKREDLEKVYSDYQRNSKFTPEFERGIKELTDYYKSQAVAGGINLQKYLDYNIQEDIIMVGFVTEEDIYGIAEYNIKSKDFDIDWPEVEASIEWYIENDFNEGLDRIVQ